MFREVNESGSYVPGETAFGCVCVCVFGLHLFTLSVDLMFSRFWQILHSICLVIDT